MTGQADAVEIVDVSARDGLQNEAVILPTDAKIQLISKAIEAGAKRLEVASFVNPKAVPAMADAENVMAALHDAGLPAKASFAGLVLNQRGMDRALSAGVDEINFVILASETFNRRNQGASITETSAQFRDAAKTARIENIPMTLTVGAAFGCPFEGEVNAGQVIELARMGSDAGVSEIAIADTIGVGDPVSVEQLTLALREAVPAVPLRFHFHDTRNTGLANAYSAWRNGVTSFDASLGGIGGCPFANGATGNVASEALTYMFSRMGVETGMDLNMQSQTARWLESVLGHALSSAVMHAGGFPASKQHAEANACLAP